MDTAEATIRGFFIGIIVAQFIPGWVSAIIIVFVLILSVFLGSFLRSLGRAVLGRIPDAIASRLPGVILSRFVEGVFPTSSADKNNNTNNFADNNANWMSPAMGPPIFTSPFDQRQERSNV